MNKIQEKIILNNHIDNLCDLYVKGRFYTVIDRAKKLRLQYKDSVAILNILGMSNAKINKHENAIINYKKAIELSPDNATTFFHLGILYHDLNQFSEAIKYYKRAISINPTYIDAIFNMAYAYIDLEDNESAKEILNKLKNIEHCNLSILLKVIFLCKFDKICDYELLYKRYCSILNNEEKTKIFSNIKSQEPVTTLIGFGRSGSLFLHSLLDGHPQISTLPGYFFKGWFSEKTWPIFRPNFEELNWRETLVEKICTYFEPQFNAHCKKNVIGEPNDNTEWFAKNLGFTQLGENKSEVLELDQQKFKSKFIELSQAYNKIDSRICFELIHEAFDKAFRIPENSSQKDKTIFYHLHNPSYFERANFHYHYPESKSLFIIRHPIQMLESWLLADLTSLPSLLEENSSFRDNYHFIKILNCGAKISYTLEYFLNPLNSIDNVRGIKLEDLKRNPNNTLRRITEWMGIKDAPLLYQSTFMGKRFSRPSTNFNNIEGFDTRSIDVSLGRIFGGKDIEILETLFWPFMDMYGYTKISKEKFLQNLKEIKPHLDKPFQFEEYIYKKLPEDRPEISKIHQFNELHRKLKNIWEILNESKTYPNLIKPLVI